jgi:2-dehydropantoate 2-reductase
MRVVVLGTGALGCLFSARLAAAPREARPEVWMLGTWSEALAAIERDGICIEEGDRTWQARVNVANDPDAAPKADLAIVVVKSYQTERAAAWAARCLTDDGLAVSLQNGLDNGSRLAAAVGAERSTIGITFEGATVLGPGAVRHAGRGATLIGQTAATAPGVSQLVGLLQAAGFEAQASNGSGDDIQGIAWGKALVNAAINPLTALFGVRNGELLANADRRELLATLAREAAAVATARGVTLPFPDAVARVEQVCRATALNKSSMLQDVERGRPTEIDSINGIIVAEGKRLNVATPANETVWRLVRGR